MLQPEVIIEMQIQQRTVHIQQNRFDFFPRQKWQALFL
jgi:hypothetical protein